MKRIFLLLALTMLVLPSVIAYTLDDILGAREITVQTELSQDITLIKKGPGYTVDLLNAELYNFPRDDINQKVLSQETAPQAEKKDDMLKFRWPSPKQNLNIKVKSTVSIQNTANPIKEKITYPIRQKLDRGYDIFLKPTQYIDSLDQEIKAKAKSITAGEDDLYMIVSKTANWVNKQVNYDANTKTEKATQKASWVMQNKQGVCDEIAGLFIALLRAADIPARFVSGLSYTNIPQRQGENWGMHGWAEVYFPERGWVPYDIAFGQYGRIDASHIKLKSTLDPRDKPVRYTWYGRDAGINATEPKIDVKIQEIKGTNEPAIEITTKTAKDKTGIGSHNLVVAEIKNLKDYYVTEELILADVDEIEIHGSQKKQAILKPNESQIITWKIKVKEDLNHEYKYAVPIEVYDYWGDASRTTFTAEDQHQTYSLDEITKIQDAVEAGELVLARKEEIQEPAREIQKQETTKEIQKEPAEKHGIMQKIIKWIHSIFT